MAIKYIPYFPEKLSGQATLKNFVRTRRMLSYKDDDLLEERLERGLPLYEMQMIEPADGGNPDGNLLLRGECVSACAYLREKNIKVDLVYIDPPFASGADYAKKVYLRQNPLVAEAIKKAQKELDMEELRSFEETMYGDKWEKERYLNWMYENLLAIKSVMSETASIYVHLDYHIGHYVKILMDEIFGEQNFRNEIIWCYYGPGSPGMKQFNRKHDTIFWYSKSDEYNFFDRQIRIAHDEKTLENFKSGLEGSGFVSDNYDLDSKGKIPEDWWEMAITGRFPKDGCKRADYATEKPWELIERIIKAGSNEGMLVADFFGGSGVTAAVASKSGRRFVHTDVGLNSIQTTRDRLKIIGAKFDTLEIKDGVTLYRNPRQTMEQLKHVIKGLRNEDQLDKMWEGSIMDSKYGMTPVYVPNLTDPTTRVLDKALMNRIMHEAMPDLPDEVKRVIVYYIDIDDKQEIEQFIKDNIIDPTIAIELRDLKPLLDQMIMSDEAEYALEEIQDGIWRGWQVKFTRYHCDRVRRRISEYNAKMALQMQKELEAGKTPKEIKPIRVSDEGLECIEWISLDCTNAEQDVPWRSDVELKIETDSHVRINGGKKSSDYWNATIRTLDDRRPLRMKVRNICGDETVFIL